MEERDYYYTYGDFREGLRQIQTGQAVIPHDVEDLRTPPHKADEGRQRHERKNTHTGKTRGKHKRARSVIAVICVLLVVFCGLLLAADFLLPDGVAGYVMSAFSAEAPKVWAVCSGTYDALNQARAAADGVRAGGGAGFIAYDGKYNVLVAAYPTLAQAQAVADKNGYALYPLLTQGMSNTDLPIAYRQKAKPLVEHHTAVYAKLYELSDQLAAGGTNVPYCKQRLSAMRDALATEAAPFLTAAENATDTETCNFRTGVLATLAALDNLQASTEAVFLADLRWTYIMVLRVNRK